jgi:hypothetical protein
MANGRKKSQSAPAHTDEARVGQLVNLAFDLAEQKLRDGTASSQIITTLLNYASQKTQLELAKLRSDLQVADAKIKQIENAETSEESARKAIEAMKSYQGYYEEEDDPDEYEYDD